MRSPFTIWQKLSARRWPSQKSPALKTIKNQIEKAQKYKTSGPGEKKKSITRYISLYLFVLHFDSTSQITLGNEILQIFPLLWDKKQKPVMHKVLNAFIIKYVVFWAFEHHKYENIKPAGFWFIFNNIIVTDHSSLKGLTQVYLLPIFLFLKVSSKVC